jgi:hypothetical protein
MIEPRSRTFTPTPCTVRPRFALNQRPSSDEEMSFLLCRHARVGHANPDS